MEELSSSVSSREQWTQELELLFSDAVSFYNLLVDIRQKPVGLPRTKKNLLFTMMCELGFDHHAAILKLTECGVLVSSALALVRPFMEAVGRAIWIHRCGREQKLAHTIKTPGCDLPDYAAMSAAVDREIQILGSTGWFTLPEAHMKELHSLTHSGKTALVLRINEDGVVAPSYSVATIRRLLVHTASFAALNGMVYCQAVAGQWEQTAADTKLISDTYHELFTAGE